MRTNSTIGLAMGWLLTGCMQGSAPPGREGGAGALASEGFTEEELGAVQIGERAVGRPTPEHGALVYRFRSRHVWVVDLTAVAVEGGDPAVAIFGPTSPDADWPLLASSDDAHGPLERLARVPLEYDREYVAVVWGEPGAPVETLVDAATREPHAFELPTFVLAEPAAGESADAAWERACAAERSRLVRDLGVNRLQGFDCGTPAPVDAGGVAAVGSMARARFVTTWPVQQGLTTVAVLGLTLTDERAAFTSVRERCARFLTEERERLGVAYAGASCGTPVEHVENGRVHFEADVTTFVFGSN